MLKALSFPGQKIVSITDDTVAYVSGNGLCILSLSTNAMSFITPNSSSSTTPTDETTTALGGISSIAACGATQHIAMAPRSLNPAIDVYDHTTHEKVYSLQGGAALDYADIVFNANGSRVAAISKLPDFALTIWDTRTQQILCTATLPEPCTTVSFNPLKDDQLCASGEKGLFMYSLTTTQEGLRLNAIKLKIKALDDDDDDSGGEHDPEDDDDFEEAQGPRNDFVCHCWNVHGQVHAATRAGEAFTVTATGATMIEAFPEFYASSGMDTGPPGDDEPRLVARAMFPTKAHIVTVHSDGKVRWLAPATFEIQRVVDLATYRRGPGGVGGVAAVTNVDELTLDHQGAQPWVVPVNATVTPGFMTVVVGTAGGVVLSLPTGQDEIADVEDFEAETFLEGGADVVVAQHVDCHADSVYAMCAVQTGGGAGGSCVFTAAADGSLRLWDTERGDLVHNTQLNSQPFVCAASAAGTAVVAVGTVNGVVRLLVVSRGDAGDASPSVPSVACVYEEKLFDKAITQLLFHPNLPYLVVTSMAAGRCYVLDVRPNGGKGCSPMATVVVDKPYAATWVSRDNTNLLLTTGDGVLW